MKKGARNDGDERGRRGEQGQPGPRQRRRAGGGQEEDHEETWAREGTTETKGEETEIERGGGGEGE